MAKYVECMKSELDLFSVPAVQTNILKTEEVCYKPIATLDNSSVIEFVSLGHGDTYRDLSSIYLRLLVKIKKTATTDYTVIAAPADGSAATPYANGPANNLLHTLFRQVSVYMNGKAISQSDNNYAYRAYLEKIISYGSDAISTHVESSGFYLDTAGAFDNLTATKNTGLDKRKAVFGGSATVELMGKIHADMFNQPKLLLNNVDLRIVMSLEKPEFYMLEADASTSVVSILDATLFMNHVTINPGILIAHEQVLSQKNAIYPYKRVEVKSYTLPQKNMSLSLHNVILGQIPNFIIVCLLDNESYSGKRSLNPFHFTSFKMSSFHLSVNGAQVPNQPITFDYTKNPVVSTRAYNNLFKAAGFNHFDKGM